MKMVNWINTIIFALTIMFLASGCAKEEAPKLKSDVLSPSSGIPVVSTSEITNVTLTGATLNGTINPKGLSTVVTFQYGNTKSYGSAIAARQNPVTGDSTITVCADITGLIPDTTYHFRVKAENPIGIIYGSDREFNHSIFHLYNVAAMEATNITATGVTLNGSVNTIGISTKVTFEYGTTTSYGNSVTAIQNPVSGNSITNISAEITGLTPCTTYHFRVKAENSLGTIYSDDKEITVGIPIVRALAATNIKRTSLTLNGTVNANGSPTIVTFSVQLPGKDVHKRIVTAIESPVKSDSITHVSVNISNFTNYDTIYQMGWYIIEAKNCCGVVYSSQISFWLPN